MLKKIAYVILALVAVLVAVGFMLPRQVHVERTISIARTPADVFPLVDSMHRFNEWSPWADLDPAVRITFSGPDRGVGSTMHWAGNSRVGTGTDTIVESVADRRVGLALDFGPQGKATAAVAFEPAAGGTKVTWTLDMDVGAGPVGRYAGLFMDRLIGPDYERGLARLKALAESKPAG